MKEQEKRSQHIAYTTTDGEPRQNEYEIRWKLKALELVQSVSDPEHRLSVLDFGCGRGEFLEMLRARNIDCVGVDYDAKCVELSSQFAPCFQASTDTLSSVLQDRLFDVVTCIHVLEHMEHPKEAVRRLADRSKRWLVFAVPNLATPVGLVTQNIKEVNEGHYQSWDAGHFKNFLEKKCGLSIVRWAADQVVLPKVSRAFEKIGIRRFFEYEFLPKHYPFLSTSLIVLCEKTGCANPAPLEH